MRTMMICAVIAIVGSAARAEDADGELRTLQGVWKLVSLRNPMYALPDASILKTQVQIDGDEWTEEIEGKPGIRSKIALGKVRDTKAIDLTSRVVVDEDEVEIEVIRGIYKLDGDTLTVARAVNGGQRPEKFEFGGSTNELAVYKRVRTR